MPDKISPERRSENMRRIRSKDSKPEMQVRRLVHAMGFRYRLHRKDLKGKPDLVFAGKRKVIFVHGCFWHGHDGCREGRTPGTNQTYWGPKIERNRERDATNIQVLEKQGWEALVVWECEIETRNVESRIRQFLS
jgi:DNA mismatch endonuclease (patch repair protein)